MFSLSQLNSPCWSDSTWCPELSRARPCTGSPAIRQDLRPEVQREGSLGRVPRVKECLELSNTTRGRFDDGEQSSTMQLKTNRQFLIARDENDGATWNRGSSWLGDDATNNIIDQAKKAAKSQCVQTDYTTYMPCWDEQKVSVCVPCDAPGTSKESLARRPDLISIATTSDLWL